MANRPAWTLTQQGVVIRRDVTFQWSAGFALTQKQKNIRALHEAIQMKSEGKALEVSTKSEDPFGRSLSAFQLKLKGRYLENVFQSSKVYEEGGPYLDLLDADPRAAKQDERHQKSGKLTAFCYQGETWALQPKTAFYDYIYVLAAREELGEAALEQLRGYQWFTDIEFNPKKSINCQARSAALLKGIVEGKRWDVLSGIRVWLSFHKATLGEDA